MKFLNGFVAAVVFVGLAGPALAQRDWTYSITPTVWSVGLSGDISLGTTPDEVRVNYSDGMSGSEIGGGFAFEANDGRLGIFVEGLVLDVSGGAEPPSILLQTAETTLDHQIWSVGATWRIRKASPEIDAVVGLRFFDVETDILIIEGDAVVKQGAASEDWLDGTFGVRVRQDIGTRWVATGYFDFGAGDSELAYQLILGMGYKVSSRVTASLGYRLLASDFQILTKTTTEPPKDVNEFHYSSMKLGGLYANVQFKW